MNLEQMISFADALRSSALRSGRSVNDCNLFVHAVMIRLVHQEGVTDDLCFDVSQLPVLTRERRFASRMD